MVIYIFQLKLAPTTQTTPTLSRLEQPCRTVSCRSVCDLVVFTWGLWHGGIVVTQGLEMQSFECSPGAEHLGWLSPTAGI